MLNWLVSTCEMFGIAAQNWMLVITGALLLYAVTLLLMRRRRRAGPL